MKRKFESWKIHPFSFGGEKLFYMSAKRKTLFGYNDSFSKHLIVKDYLLQMFDAKYPLSIIVTKKPSEILGKISSDKKMKKKVTDKLSFWGYVQMEIYSGKYNLVLLEQNFLNKFGDFNFENRLGKIAYIGYNDVQIPKAHIPFMNNFKRRIKVISRKDMISRNLFNLFNDEQSLIV